jgi:uncharacterized FlgJ-related protein
MHDKYMFVSNYESINEPIDAYLLNLRQLIFK